MTQATQNPNPDDGAVEPSSAEESGDILVEDPDTLIPSGVKQGYLRELLEQDLIPESTSELIEIRVLSQDAYAQKGPEKYFQALARQRRGTTKSEVSLPRAPISEDITERITAHYTKEFIERLNGITHNIQVLKLLKQRALELPNKSVIFGTTDLMNEWQNDPKLSSAMALLLKIDDAVKFTSGMFDDVLDDDYATQTEELLHREKYLVIAESVETLLIRINHALGVQDARAKFLKDQLLGIVEQTSEGEQTISRKGLIDSHYPMVQEEFKAAQKQARGL